MLLSEGSKTVPLTTAVVGDAIAVNDAEGDAIAVNAEDGAEDGEAGGTGGDGVDGKGAEADEGA